MPPRGRNASDKFLKGEEVRIWRLSRGFSQLELAKYLGLTAQAVGKYEARGITKATALALAAIDRGLRPFKPTEEDYRAAQYGEKRITRKVLEE
jgi:transcriptional regulator with XRE-family HTH domain